MYMTQLALVYTLIKSIDLDYVSKQHQIPAAGPPLRKHEESTLLNEKWSNRSLICMLTYLSRNTRLDIKYAVSDFNVSLDNPILMS